MSKILSDRIVNLHESQTLAMARKSRELADQGHEVISLSLGEPDFDTPEFIKEAAKKAIDDNYSHYTPVAGYLDVRQAISKKFKRDNHLDYAPNQIVISTGAKQSLINALMVMVNPGDEVIILTPFWVSYEAMVQLAEGVPVRVSAGVVQDFKPTAAQIEAAITSKTKVLMFSSPCNPTGSVFNREELEALAAVLRKHPHIFVIADEIYELINFGNEHVSIASLPGMYDRTITINGLSKGYAMTGWRLGYLGAPLEIAQACDKLQGQFTSATCSITQRAAIAALEAPKSAMDFMKTAFLKRRDLVLIKMAEIPGFVSHIPEGAFYVFPDVSAILGKSFKGTPINNTEDLCLYLLNEAHVALVTGDAFGAPNCIRISYAASEEKLSVALERIQTALEKLI